MGCESQSRLPFYHAKKKLGENIRRGGRDLLLEKQVENKLKKLKRKLELRYVGLE